MPFDIRKSLGEAAVTAPTAPGTSTGTIAAGVDKVLSFDCSTASRICIVITNTGGTNPINATKLEKSATGVAYGEDTAVGAAIGSLAAGASVLIELSDCSFDVLRLTFSSASGTTYSVDFKGVR